LRNLLLFLINNLYSQIELASSSKSGKKEKQLSELNLNKKLAILDKSMLIIKIIIIQLAFLNVIYTCKFILQSMLLHYFQRWMRLYLKLNLKKCLKISARMMQKKLTLKN